MGWARRHRRTYARLAIYSLLLQTLILTLTAGARAEAQAVAALTADLAVICSAHGLQTRDGTGEPKPVENSTDCPCCLTALYSTLGVPRTTIIAILVPARRVCVPAPRSYDEPSPVWRLLLAPYPVRGPPLTQA